MYWKNASVAAGDAANSPGIGPVNVATLPSVICVGVTPTSDAVFFDASYFVVVTPPATVVGDDVALFDPLSPQPAATAATTTNATAKRRHTCEDIGPPILSAAAVPQKLSSGKGLSTK